MFLNFLLYENMIWKFLIRFERLDYMHENKTFFLNFFRRKPGILIPDLYLYNIKIQTDIKQNW